MKGISTGVWERSTRSGAGEMSKNLFALAISGFTLMGIVASMLAAQISKDWTFSSGLQSFGFFAGVLVLAIAGIVMSVKSDNPVVSMLGYAFVAIPFGLMLGPVMAMYTTASIVKVLLITSTLVLVLGIVGAVIPDSLESWGVALSGGMIILLVGLMVVPFAGALGVDVGGAMTWLDWVGVALFAGMVIYDLNRAMRVSRTLDNAIDVAVSVYLDWLNLFVRLLSLLGGDTSDD